MHSLTIVAILIVANCYFTLANPISNLFGAVDTETPPYDVISKGTKYEVRRYRSQLWAQVEYTVDASTDFGDKLSIGFQPLFQYITGKNEKEQKIPMTAPVVMQQVNSDSTRRRMAFIMPASEFTELSQLPKPTDSTVKLIAVNEPLALACITFNMGITSKRVDTREEELRQATTADKIQLVTGRENVRVGGYNPPWTLPWFRKNELCIPLVNQA
ncbi:unnamed protein product [Adineta ricciae]|uniref:SOUL heme-binding protein n=1 Tax=Adineta ricciae TaxID=249248 RepID=A0A815FIK7_ADIRI|nr:unnamed protein product [Adineta ricciae]CAF1414037.1 unnamed protein product [Adineta ricciae]